MQCSAFGHIATVVNSHNSLNLCMRGISEGELFHLAEEVLSWMSSTSTVPVGSLFVRMGSFFLRSNSSWHLVFLYYFLRLMQATLDILIPFISNTFPCYECQRFGYSKACHGSHNRAKIRGYDCTRSDSICDALVPGVCILFSHSYTKSGFPLKTIYKLLPSWFSHLCQ